ASVTPGVGPRIWQVSAKAMATRPMPTPVRYTSRGMVNSPFASGRRQARQEGAGPALDAVVLPDQRPGRLAELHEVAQVKAGVAAGPLAADGLGELVAGQGGQVRAHRAGSVNVHRRWSDLERLRTASPSQLAGLVFGEADHEQGAPEGRKDDGHRVRP